MSFDPPYPHYPPCYSGKCGDRPCCARGNRYNWPEAVGMDAEMAISLINKTNPLVTVAKVPKGAIVFQDFCCNRVYLFVDPNNNKVAKLPQVG